MKHFIVALEGLVHAGKTTLKNRIEKVASIQCVGEYREYTSESFPDPPRNQEEAIKGREYFLHLETLRKNALVGREGVVVLDRSVFSILGYHYGIEKTKGIQIFRDSLEGIKREEWIIPNGCLYLDISDGILEERHRAEKGKYQSILLDRKFNAMLRTFYEEVLSACFPQVAISRIDASKGQKVAYQEAIAAMQSMLK